MCELDAETVARATRLYADVPEEAVETGDFAGRRGVGELRPFADLLEDPRIDGESGGDASDGGESDGDADDDEQSDGDADDGEEAASAEVVVVASVGSAVLDAATAAWLVDRAAAAGVGETVEL